MDIPWSSRPLLDLLLFLWIRARRDLCEAREDGEAAETAFRALFRLSRDEPGRPRYPEFSWDMLQYYLDWHEGE